MTKEIEELNRIWSHYLKIGHSPYSDAILFGELASKNLDWVSENAHNNLKTIIDAMHDIRDPIYAANYMAIMVIYTRDIIPSYEDCKYIITNRKIQPFLVMSLLENKDFPIDLLKAEYFDSINTFASFSNETCAEIRDLRDKVIEERIHEVGAYLHEQNIIENISMASLETLPKEWLVKVYGY